MKAVDRGMALLPRVRAASKQNSEQYNHDIIVRLAVKGNTALNFTMQIYSYEALGTGVPRHCQIPEGALLFWINSR